MSKNSIEKATDTFKRINKSSIKLEKRLFANKTDFEQVQLIDYDFAQTAGNKISQQYDSLLKQLLTHDELKEHTQLLENTHYNYAIHLISLRYYYDACFKLASTIDEKKQCLTLAYNYSNQAIYHMENVRSSCKQEHIKSIEGFLCQYETRFEEITIELQKIQIEMINNAFNKEKKLASASVIEAQETAPLPEASMRTCPEDSLLGCIINHTYKKRSSSPPIDTRDLNIDVNMLSNLSFFNPQNLSMQEGSLPLKKRYRPSFS